MKLTQITQEIGTTGQRATVTICGSAQLDISEAITHEHDCDNNACDICAAHHSGYPLIAAGLLSGATETPLLDSVVSAHEFNRTLGKVNPLSDVYRLPEWDEWASYFKSHSLECDCGSRCFEAESGDSCGNCGAEFSQLSEWKREARRLGEEAAKNAASWICNGNTSQESIRQLLTWLENGDPIAEQYLPATPSLSGEWADSPTPLSLAKDITGDDEVTAETMEALSDEFESGVSETFEAECERELNRWLAD